MTTKPVAIVVTDYRIAEPWLNENAESFSRPNMRGETYDGKPFIIVVLREHDSINRYRGQEWSELRYIGPEPRERDKQILFTMVR